MIELKLKNYQAIQLDSLLQTLSLLSSETLPDAIRQELARGFSDNSDLKVVAAKLRAKLARLSQIQEEKIEEWARDEDLKPVPLGWSDYNDYLLGGGQLEYPAWREQKQ